jgi:hypothetical protein
MYSMENNSTIMNDSIMLYAEKWMEFGIIIIATTSQPLMWSYVESGLTMDVMIIVRLDKCKE